jgi:Arc/MetJ family transcription regulator
MRTTLNLDELALKQALEASPGKTKTEVINTALRDYVRRKRISEIGELEGKYRWEGSLDDLRLREPAAE